MTIRTNDNENMIELYLFKMDENLINKIKEFDFINYQISSVYYQIQNCSKIILENLIYYMEMNI